MDKLKEIERTWINQMARRLGAHIAVAHYSRCGEYILLASRDLPRGIEWVTWRAKVDREKAEADFYWGHYFNDESNATKDYLERVKKIDDFLS